MSRSKKAQQLEKLLDVAEELADNEFEERMKEQHYASKELSLLSSSDDDDLNKPIDDVLDENVDVDKENEVDKSNDKTETNDIDTNESNESNDTNKNESILDENNEEDENDLNDSNNTEDNEDGDDEIDDNETNSEDDKQSNSDNNDTDKSNDTEYTDNTNNDKQNDNTETLTDTTNTTDNIETIQSTTPYTDNSNEIETTQDNNNSTETTENDLPTKPSVSFDLDEEKIPRRRKHTPKPKRSHSRSHSHHDAIKLPPHIHKNKPSSPTSTTYRTTTKPENKPVETEITLSNEHKTEEQINAEINERKQQIMNEIKKQVEELEKNDKSLKIDLNEYITPTDSTDPTDTPNGISNETDNHNKYFTYLNYLLGNTLLPDDVGNQLRAIDYINSITSFKYDPYDSPNQALQHTLAENVLTINKLNDIFEAEIIPVMIDNYHFDDIDEKVCLFLEKYKSINSTNLEYNLIRSFLAKLIYSLSTSTELALREKKVIHVDAKYKKALLHDLDIMKHLQTNDGKFIQSWNKFIEAFFGLDGDNLVYNFESYTKLNSELEVAYKEDFLMEILLANTLKTYFPSISINYFYAIKSVYIMVRLLTVYIDKLKRDFIENHKNINVEKVMNDINVIGHIGTMIYEIKNYTFKQMSRTLPSCKNGMHNKTEMYILNHIFTGGQYYLLKMLEKSLPCLGNLLANVK